MKKLNEMSDNMMLVIIFSVLFAIPIFTNIINDLPRIKERIKNLEEFKKEQELINTQFIQLKDQLDTLEQQFKKHGH